MQSLPKRARRFATLLPAVVLVGLLSSVASGVADTAGLGLPAVSTPVLAPIPTPVTLPLPTPTPSPTPSLGVSLPALPGGSSSGTTPATTSAGSTGAAPAAPDSSSSATTAAPAGPAAPATQAAPSIAKPEDYKPSAQEAADLPNDPGRLYYEGEQLILADQFAQFEKQFGSAALAAGGGAGAFGPPLVSTKGVLISQLFGCSSFDLEPYNPGCNSRHWHTGVDFVEPAGTPVFAADAGVARVFRDPGGYGNHVVIFHGNGFVTLYAHLSAFAVEDGQTLKRGDLVGLVGSTGFSTGDHLHFEIRHENTYLDPCAFIGCQG